MQGRLVVTGAPHRINHIQALAPMGDHLGQEVHRVLTIGVHQNHHVAAHRLKAGGHGRFFAKIA